ncbi:hypothetical protein [Litorihabitans aurantiacus]|uniref:Uncharacterized protein n=1 Tax=Litorihabitans aurantiacus TaxID=1930061 RepID=A0AA38CTG8_9MICO|nr:hypothetical protein [Litorihabitans aurantiacus]GMA31435.1 hypothetical protein GCM10025875_14270 [Litorihabitans aurantiacus]
MRWLRPHADSPTLARDRVPARVAWLTGQSSWRHQRLSPAQHRVLDALAAQGYAPVRAGFPWTQRAAERPWRGERLGTASVRNTVQGLAARPGSRFGDAVAHHLQPLLTTTDERLLLLCASAGARMIWSATAAVRVPPGLRIDVVGIGPVGALPPTEGPWHVHRVRGERDRISALGHRTRADALVPGGHLDAATSAAAVTAVLALVGPAATTPTGGAP